MARQKTVPITARVAPSIVDRLKSLAEAEERSVSFLVAEALERYLADEEWQVAHIQAAVARAKETDPSEYISNEDVEAEMDRLLVELEAEHPAAPDDRAPAA
jgi:RHH-type rel operon transcriptional repressor/antitoxin RelB